MNMATSPASYSMSQQRRPSSMQRGNGSSRLQGLRRAVTDRATLDQSLGWLSLGLGLTQVLAPKTLGRMIGVGDQSTLMRMCGVREIVSGVGLLSGRAPAAFAMSRVVGDAMDLALLGAALRSPQADPARIAAAATAVAGVAAADLYASKLDMQASMAEASQEVPVTVSLMINSASEKLYEF